MLQMHIWTGYVNQTILLVWFQGCNTICFLYISIIHNPMFNKRKINFLKIRHNVEDLKLLFRNSIENGTLIFYKTILDIACH